MSAHPESGDSPSGDRDLVSGLLKSIRGHWLYSKLSFEDTAHSAIVVGGTFAMLSVFVWFDFTVVAFLAYAFCLAAIFNAVMVLAPDSASKPDRIRVPEDREQIRAVADWASENVQHIAAAVNNALSFEDVYSSAVLLALVFVLTPFASLVTAQVALGLIVLAAAACTGDRLAKAQVDSGVTTTVEPLLARGAAVVRKLSTRARTELAALPKGALPVAAGAVGLAALTLGSISLVFFLVRVASAVLLVHTAAEAVLPAAAAAVAGGDGGDSAADGSSTWATGTSSNRDHED